MKQIENQEIDQKVIQNSCLVKVQRNPIQEELSFQQVLLKQLEIIGKNLKPLI